MFKIVKYPDPILRKKALPVKEFGQQLADLVQEMGKLMYADDGVGLAAPQIGVRSSILIIGLGQGKFKAYINPEITFSSKDQATMEEGCLSLPGIFGYVSRPKKIHIKYQDLAGKVQKEKLKGFDAVIFQHEMDHLQGILFIDRTDKISKGQAELEKLKAKLNDKLKN
ncbi:MAG: peptide deformylase [Patescibacteria group bacterium]|nr:peptide deformylase [Patescibacteria group bacterium]